MSALLQSLWRSDFMPHAWCLRDGALIAAHAIADGIIALSYFLIPAGLLWLLRRRDLLFRSIILLYAIFIFACGITHGMAIYTLWHPVYRLEAAIKLVTAVISLPAALLFLRIVPQVLTLPSAAQLQHEIDERRRTEEALRASEERLRLAQQAGGIGIWEWQPAQPVVANEQLRALLELDLTLPLSLTLLLRRVYRPDRSRVAWKIRLLREGRRTSEFDCRVRLQDGSLRWISIQAEVHRGPENRVLRVLGIATDSTERKRAEDSLRETSERFRTLALAMPSIFFTCDRTGRQTFSNTALEEYTGRTYAQLLGDGWLQAIVPEDQEVSGYLWDHCLKAGEPYQMEHRLQRVDGQVRWHLTRCVPMKNGAGEIQSWYGTSTDIDERKRAEANLERLVMSRTAALGESVEKLQSALAEKTVLLKEVHHRVKNNLAVVASLLGMQAELTQDEHAAATLAEGQQRIHAMAVVHEHLYSTEQLDRVNFAEYAQQLADELHFSIAPNPAAVLVRVEAESIEVPVDSAIPCGLILNELLSNAFKYAFPNGRPGELLIRFSRPEPGWLTLEVRDNGVGMPPGLDWQNAPSLGLRIVTILAKQVKARFRLVPGPGTHFEMTFPDRPKS